MAGVKFFAQTDEMTTGTAKKTLLQIVAPANQRIKVKEWSISFDGITNTAQPIKVEVIRQSTAGSGGDALTLVKKNAGDDETLQSSALSNIDGSSSPTDTSVLQRENVHPQGGHTWQAPFGEELVVKGGERLGIAVTAEAAVNAVVRMDCEE